MHGNSQLWIYCFMNHSIALKTWLTPILATVRLFSYNYITTSAGIVLNLSKPFCSQAAVKVGLFKLRFAAIKWGDAQGTFNCNIVGVSFLLVGTRRREHDRNNKIRNAQTSMPPTIHHISATPWTAHSSLRWSMTTLRTLNALLLKSMFWREPMRLYSPLTRLKKRKLFVKST